MQTNPGNYTSTSYPRDSLSGYFLQSSSSYSKITEYNPEKYSDDFIDDAYYKKSVLKKKVIAHVSE